MGLQGPGRWCGPGTRPRLEIPEERNAYSAPSQPPAAPPPPWDRSGWLCAGRGCTEMGRMHGLWGAQCWVAALGSWGWGLAGKALAGQRVPVPFHPGGVRSRPSRRPGRVPTLRTPRPLGVAPADRSGWFQPLPSLAWPRLARPPAPQPGLQGRWKVDEGAGIEGGEAGARPRHRGGPRALGTRGCP